MIIDIHTHAFPDQLAPRAMAKLIDEFIGDPYIPISDGTVAGLLQTMDDWGIDISVIQPVITKQSQVKTVNEWAQQVCSDRLISFGAIDVHSDDYKKDIDLVAGLVLKGLKFHAEYQNFVIDTDKMLKVYDYALAKGLILLHHAGYDPGFLPPFKSSPQQFLRIVEAMQGGTIIAAHLGGHAQWDAVEQYLVGTDIYLDTSMGFEYFPAEQFMRIVKNHGADRILFASDSPWSNAGTEIEHLQSLPLTVDETESILGGNAKRILGL
jgi:predicted TIM-barrel fold metal-dependent hydrolase